MTDIAASWWFVAGRLTLHLVCDRAAVTNATPSMDTGILLRRLWQECQWAAIHGDTATARRRLAAIRAETGPDQRRYAFGISLLDAWIASATNEWEEVIRVYDETVTRFPNLQYQGYKIPLQWLLGEAHDNLGRLDEASIHYKRVLSPTRWGQIDPLVYGLAYSFAYQRLMLLYSKMGRVEDARRHWEIFEKTFTNPDPELVPMIDEARQALAAAEAKL